MRTERCYIYFLLLFLAVASGRSRARGCNLSHGSERWSFTTALPGLYSLAVTPHPPCPSLASAFCLRGCPARTRHSGIRPCVGVCVWLLSPSKMLAGITRAVAPARRGLLPLPRECRPLEGWTARLVRHPLTSSTPRPALSVPGFACRGGRALSLGVELRGHAVTLC